MLAAACAIGTPAGFAQEVTLKGEIVDPASYLTSGRHGPEMEATTYEAVDGGQSLALLDESAHALYLLLAEEPGEDPNELVYDVVNKVVKVTGTVVERDGLRGIVVTAVEPVEATPPPSPPAAAAPPTALAAP